MSLKITPNRTQPARPGSSGKTSGAKGLTRSRPVGGADATDATDAPEAHAQDGFEHDHHDESPKRPPNERAPRGPALAGALAQPAGAQGMWGVRHSGPDAALMALARRVLDAYAHAPAPRQAQAHEVLTALG